ncbi:MAG TPA: hypothetical protein VN829_22050 [Dongiaceae bacterium]|nr:hypothetical protein [Dongiaceae bacterium]
MVADNQVAVSIEGPGRLLGLCSGDPASHENPKAGRMKVFNGLLLAIVQSDGRPGDIAVRASSPGLTSQPVYIQSLALEGLDLGERSGLGAMRSTLQQPTR